MARKNLYETQTGKVNNQMTDLYGTNPYYPQYAHTTPEEPEQPAQPTPTVTPQQPEQPKKPKKMKDVDPTDRVTTPDIDGKLPQYDFKDGKDPQFTWDGTAPEFNQPGQDEATRKAYEDAMETLEKAKGQTPDYTSQYDAQIKSLYEQIIGRGPFQYDSKTDPLYQQYAQDYQQQGQMAMRDTMGQAAALTGGYGSSYGQAVGQQQYDAYLQKMADILPQTYGMALDAYNAEGNRLQNALDTTRSLEQSDYGRYLDKLSQYNTDLDRARSDADKAYQRMINADETNYDRAVDEYNRARAAYDDEYSKAIDEYNRGRDEYDRNYARQQDEYNRMMQEDQIRYNREMDKYDMERDADKYNRSIRDDYYDRLVKLIGVGYEPTAEDYANAGLTVEQGQAIRQQYLDSQKPNVVYVDKRKNAGEDAGSSFYDLFGEWLGGENGLNKKRGTKKIPN